MILHLAICNISHKRKIYEVIKIREKYAKSTRVITIKRTFKKKRKEKRRKILSECSFSVDDIKLVNYFVKTAINGDYVSRMLP